MPTDAERIAEIAGMARRWAAPLAPRHALYDVGVEVLWLLVRLAERDAMLAEAIGVFGIRFDGAICPFCSGREEYNDHKPDCLVTRIRALGIGKVKGDG